MQGITRRNLIAAAPVAGLAGMGLAIAPGAASAAATGMVELISPIRIQDSRTMEPDKYDTSASDTILVPGLAGKSGVIVNVTVTETEGVGFFRVAEDIEPVPSTSNINWYAVGQTIANLAIVKVTPPTGGISMQGGGNGRAHLIIDVLGFIV
jgi:hypothetical protein